MAVLLNRQLIFLFLFFLPQLSFSNCPTSISCDPSIEIYPPFYANEDPDCIGIYLIQCNGGRPTIQFKNSKDGTDNYTVKNISYGQDNTITVQPQDYPTFYSDSTTCSFLYNFTNPIPHFELPHPYVVEAFDISTMYRCKWGKHDDFPLLRENYNYSACKNFTFYYSDKSKEGHPSTCQAPKAPPLLEYTLSFAKVDDDDGLSLLFAGFSNSLKLDPDCFEENVCTFYYSTESQEGLSSACRAPEAPRIEYRLSFANNDDGLSLLLIGFSNSLKLDPSCFQDNICNNDAVINRHKKILIAASGGFAGILLIILLLLCLCSRKFHKHILWRKKSNGSQNVEAFLEKYGTLAPKRYTYSNVKKMTHSFDDKLGQGVYGSVYEGSLSDGRLVAVKVLKISNGNGEEFVNEIASIGESSHVNIVNLLGFCSEGSKRALIYEYMCNRSLDKLLCSEKPKTTLDWERLYQIAIGIARGLEYLHRRCNTRIVHFDIKPHNILLDKDFCPKISDFGLAKLCLRKDNILSMEGMRGTIGYIAPEIFSRNFGVVSSKSDIYSYGMMVLEMAGGRKNMHLDAQNTSDNYFPHYIYKYLAKNEDLLTYGVTAETEGLAKKMILIGLWCIQTRPQNRPPITRVIEMWEGSIDDL